MAQDEPKTKDVESLDISFLDLYQLLELFVTLLSEQAWRNIGLKVNPRTNEIKKDFRKAHLAIDSIISIVDKLEPNVAGDVRNRLRTIISDLQINYIRQLEENSADRNAKGNI
ncbi:MAG: DUF1844 domain-containing protein [Candidatus Bathyarchaeota archaeon]